nr:hypothetical protein [Methanothermobacter sp. THM-2]
MPILDELCEWGRKYGTHEK